MLPFCFPVQGPHGTTLWQKSLLLPVSAMRSKLFCGRVAISHTTWALIARRRQEFLKRIRLRSGCTPGLLPALQVWAYVQSVPEAQKAIVALGKRDAAFDSGLPTPALHYRPGEAAPKPAPAHWSLTKMMDQHAYMQIGGQDEVRVGDMIGFDISHPCLTFDKWRVLPVLNAEYQVVDVVQTFFMTVSFSPRSTTSPTALSMRLQRFCRNPYTYGAHIVCNLLRPRRTDDRRSHLGSAQNPGQRHLRHRQAEVGRNGFELLDGRQQKVRAVMASG